MGGVVGGILGDRAASANRDAASNAQRSALEQYLGISTPDIAGQQLSLEDYINMAPFQAQTQQALQMAPSAMGQIQTDPRLVNAQMSALNHLSQTGELGMSPGQKAALLDAQNNAAAQAQAKNKQILDQFARTGMGGSGAQLAAQLQNSQGAAQMLANNSNQIAQQAQQNALQAISQSGALGGQIRSQGFGEQADVAKARDYINQFNTQNAQNVQNSNVANQNAAALRNLNQQQSTANQNTQMHNQQQQYNKQLQQQQFNNQMALAAGRAGQYQGIAQTNQQNAGRTADMYAGIGQGVDTAVGGIYNASQKGNNANNNYMNGYFDAQPPGPVASQGFKNGPSYDASDAADAFTRV